jgi:probable selenium-dependent hydroxylase accessory protein YqeC
MIFVKSGLSEALFGGKLPRFTAFIGGGGKTTSISAREREFTAKGETVVVTTTTKTHPPEDLSLLAGSAADVREILKTHKSCCAGAVVVPNHKMRGLPEAELALLSSCADRVLVEADGSRGRPLKVPREYEPVIPACADAVVMVMGLDGIGAPVAESVHCPELACEFLGVSPGHLVTPRDAADIFLGFYVKKAAGQNPAAELVVLLNKYDGGLRARQAAELSGLLKGYRVVVR